MEIRRRIIRESFDLLRAGNLQLPLSQIERDGWHIVPGHCAGGDEEKKNSTTEESGFHIKPFACGFPSSRTRPTGTDHLFFALVPCTLTSDQLALSSNEPTPTRPQVNVLS